MAREPSSTRPDGATRRACELMAERFDKLVDGWFERMWFDPEYADWATPETREPTYENARRDIGRELEALHEGFELPLSCPDEVATSARLAVSWDFPLSGVLQCYRAGHEVQWHAWLECVERLELPGEEGLGPLRRRPGLFLA